MHKLARMVAILSYAVVLLCVGMSYARAGDIAVLGSIIEDKQTQMTDPGTITAAMSALGDMGSTDGAGILLDNILYPEEIRGLTAEEVSQVPFPFGDDGGDYSVGPDGRWWMTSKKFPAVRALVEIGPDVIPLVIERLVQPEAGTDNDLYRNAYLDVLIELMDQNAAQALLEKALDQARSIEIAERLQKSIDMLPDLRPMMELRDPTNPGDSLVTPESEIVVGRKKLLKMAKLSIPPMIVANNVAHHKNAMVEGTTLAPVNELANLLHVTAKRSGSKLILFSTGAEPKTLVLYRDAKSALAGSQKILLPIAPVVRGNELLIPLRAVAEYFGAQVRWDPSPMVAWVQPAF